jgi:predicted RecA/RadA family phage recombinase
MLQGKRHFPESAMLAIVAGAAISSGDVVSYGPRPGIAQTDAASGDTVVLHTQGEFTLTKGTGYTLSVGQRVMWNEEDEEVQGWTPASLYPCMGICSAAAGTNDTTASVCLGDVPPRVFATEHTVTTDDAAANSTNGQVDIDTGFGAAPSAVVAQVRTVTTGRIKSAFDVLTLSGGDLGKVRISGVGSGTQLDAGDIIALIAYE